MADSYIEQHLKESSRVKLSLLPHVSAIQSIIDALLKVIKSGGCIYTCGNGGSTCDAMHFVEELVAIYRRSRPGIRAQHLCDPSTLTCWANDRGFDGVFERQVRTHLTPNDALVVLSTSGNSPNIIGALKAAKEQGAVAIALLGKTGGQAKALSNQALVVESDATCHIQEAHITIIHIICDRLEVALFPDAK